MTDPTGDVRRDALAHLDALYGFALSLTRRGPDAEDLVQETYVRAFRFADRFQPGTHLRAWLFQILRNTFLTAYRRRVREAAIMNSGVPAGVDGPWEAPTPEPAAGTVLDLERALATLPEEFRSVLLFADLEGLTLGEIAEIMGTPVGTVKSRLFRARRLLRHHLADYRAI